MCATAQTAWTTTLELTSSGSWTAPSEELKTIYTTATEGR
jgi:hypothetical protein